MTAALIALAAGLAVAAGGLVALAVEWATAERRNASLTIDARQSADAAKRLIEALNESQARRRDEVARLERVVAGLKTEIAKLEGEVDGCHEPAAIRARLRCMRMLACPEDATRASGAVAAVGAGGLPGATDARVGAR